LYESKIIQTLVIIEEQTIMLRFPTKPMLLKTFTPNKGTVSMPKAV